MTQIPPEVFERAALSGVILPALPYIEEALKELEETRLKVAMTEISHGSLSPDKALSILMEIKSYRDVLRKMRKACMEKPQ